MRCARRSRTGAAPHRVLGAVAALVCGQCGARAQVRAHQQRVEHTGSRARVGEALVAARSHARERERSADEHPRERARLLDVLRGVGADQLRIAMVVRRGISAPGMYTRCSAAKPK